MNAREAAGRPVTLPPTCVWCTGFLRMVRDKTPAGVMHPECADAWRRRNPVAERDTTLPKHLR